VIVHSGTGTLKIRKNNMIIRFHVVITSNSICSINCFDIHSFSANSGTSGWNYLVCEHDNSMISQCHYSMRYYRHGCNAS